LAAVGLLLIEDFAGVDAKRRYSGDRRDDLFLVAASHIAHASAPERLAIRPDLTTGGELAPVDKRIPEVSL